MQLGLDPVDRCNQEVAGAHGDVRHVETEELGRGIVVVKFIQTREVSVERRVERVLQEMVDGEALRVVAPGRLACP